MECGNIGGIIERGGMTRCSMTSGAAGIPEDGESKKEGNKIAADRGNVSSLESTQ